MEEELKTKDTTRQSPKQENDVDCGIFTILSIYLISKGVHLQRTSYDQHIVTQRKLQRTIVLSLIKSNEIPTPGVMNNFVIPERCNATTASRLKKRKKSESRLTVGKSKVQKGITGIFQSPSNLAKLLDNRKQAAKSLTDAQLKQRTIAQMLLQPPKKAKKLT